MLIINVPRRCTDGEEVLAELTPTDSGLVTVLVLEFYYL